MEFEWDEGKRLSNLAKHGLDFHDVDQMDWSTVVIKPDLRLAYGEDRFQAFAFFGDQLCQVVFTQRSKTIRVMSFRRASRKERRAYGP